MSKLSTRPVFTNPTIQDTDEFWINVDNLDTTFTSQKMTGLQLKSLLTGSPLVENVVFIDQNTPTTGGVTFDPNTPATVDTLYISSTNGSTWIWNGTAYVTYSVPAVNSTPFSLSANSAIDAGSNKTSPISRIGSVNVGTATNYVNLNPSSGIYHVANGYSQLTASSYSDTAYPIFRTYRYRGTIASPTYAINGDMLGLFSFATSSYESASIKIKATESHSFGTRGSEIIFSNCVNGSGTLIENLKIQQDGKVSIPFGIDARVQSVSSSATVTPTSTNDEVIITAQAVGLTLANPTGTFTEGQAIIIRVKDNGTAQTIAYGTNYRGTTLPTTTTVGTTTYIPLIYNATDGKFDNLSASGITTTIPVVIQLACSDETTALTAGTSKVTFRMPHAMTLTSVRASLNVAGTTSGITTIDINEGGTSILSTKLTIDLTEKTSTTAVTPSVISDTSLADDAEITIDIDAISGGATEKGLKISLIGTRTI